MARRTGAASRPPCAIAGPSRDSRQVTAQHHAREVP